MGEDERGFIIKDSRSFGHDGELKKEEKKETETHAKTQAENAKRQDNNKKPPIPEVNFNSLIFSLSSSALLHIGDIADPETGEKKKDLQMAKYSIDIVAMLKEKTKGNLDDEEQKFVDNILADLRMRYVKAAKGQ